MAEPREASIRVANVNDQAAAKDSLGFEPYVMAVAGFLTNPDTQPPLTLSVESPWGRGKSSFMKQLQQAIEKRTQEQTRDRLHKKREKCISNIQDPEGYLRESTERELKKLAHSLRPLSQPRKLLSRKLLLELPKFLLLVGSSLVLFPILCSLVLIYVSVNLWKILWLSFRIKFTHKPKTIWFNAWRHEKAEALWAAFALAFLEEISKPRHPLDIMAPMCGHLKLLLARFEWHISSFCDLSRKVLQLVLLVSAIALLIIFIFFKGYNWVDQLGNGLNNIADNLGRPPEKIESAETGFGDEFNKVSNHLCKQNEFCKPVDQPDDQAIKASKTKTREGNSPGSGEKKEEGKSAASISWQELPIIGTLLGTGGLATLWLLQQLQKVIGSPKKELTDYLESPDYVSQVSFIEKFHADFKKIVDAYAGKGNKVYVFIDDLDRCEVPKSADLMQAINLMIANDPQLVFILGLDREKVAAGLALKHKEIIPYLSSVQFNGQGQEAQEKNRDTTLQGIEYGYSFLEKFIQLPFLLPQPSQADFELFMDQLSPVAQPEESLWLSIWAALSRSVGTYWDWLTKLESPPDTTSADEQTATSSDKSGEDNSSSVQERFRAIKIKTGSDSEEVRHILTMVAPVLDWNPRRLKRFLNLFRLRAYIADATGLFYNSDSTDSVDPAGRTITLEQLGKFTAIGLQYPLLLIEIMKHNHLLFDLQRHALQESQGNSEDDSNRNTQQQLEPWIHQQQLMKLLCYGCSEKHTPANLRGKIDYSHYSFENIEVGKLLQVSPRVHPIDQIDLVSERGVNYATLRSLLKAQKWREADKETFRVMLEAVGKNTDDYLDLQDLTDFPCKDLQTIDQLWVVASRGRFGFSVQKQIYIECGANLDGRYPVDRIWYEFCERVGWRHQGELLFYRDLEANPSISPAGEIPARWAVGGALAGGIGVGSLLSHRAL